MWEMAFCLEIAENLFSLYEWITSASLFWPFWTYFTRWGPSKDLNGISCFICQEKKNKPFGNGAICYCLGSLFIQQLASG